MNSRLCAVTDAGPGDDSMASAPVKVEDPNGMCDDVKYKICGYHRFRLIEHMLL